MTGIISDLHIPFEKEGFIKWTAEQFKLWGVDSVICIGDIIDHHAISFHTSEPEALSPTSELELALDKLELLKELFPVMKICRGNHDRLPKRKMKEMEVPENFMKNLAEVYDFPEGWEIADEWIIDEVLYTHTATGISGARNMAIAERISCVVGHAHSFGKIDYITNRRGETIFGMYVGCGIEKESYGMRYGKAFKLAPQLGCGIVVDSKEAYFVPYRDGNIPTIR